MPSLPLTPPALALALALAPATAAQAFLGPLQVNDLPATPALHLRYGDDAEQVGELRVPPGPGPHPVIVVLHGGCWQARHGPGLADLKNTSPLASALTAEGYATWNLEYRRVDNPGGGWPGTFLDVARGIDHLRVLARDHRLDLGRVGVVGHSAGGHLGTWAAARPRLPAGSELRTGDPLPITGVVNLAGPGDLERFAPQVPLSCRAPNLERLLGGTPQDVPHRWREGSPHALLPIGVPQVVINGLQDKIVPFHYTAAYREAAVAAGDRVDFVGVENAAHFEPIAPGSVAWPHVRAAVRQLLGPP